MTSQTEVKLLTLLNVTAIKKPRALDQPGGYRGSPSVSDSPRQSRGPSHAGSSSAAHLNGVCVGAAGTNGTHDQPLINGTMSNLFDENGSGSGDVPRPKKRKSVVFAGEVGPSGSTYSSPVKALGKGKGKGKASEVTAVIGSPRLNGALNGDRTPSADLVVDVDVDEDAEGESAEIEEDMFHVHFGPTPSILTKGQISAVDEDAWSAKPISLTGYGKATSFAPKGYGEAEGSAQNRIIPSLLSAVEQSTSLPLLSQAVSHLGSYKDLYLHSMDDEADGSEKVLFGDQKEAMRKAITVHALNHVLKTRRRIIRNSEKLAHPPEGGDPPEPPRDQSFTRPKVLLLFPLRSLALHYLIAHFLPLAPSGTQIENLRPFTSSFSLSPDLEDPLAAPSALTSYPVDHIVNFQGNSDDNFRFGIKITRKAWRLVMMPANQEKLLDCDFILASPLGMKMAADKEKSTDLLSSIEICVADGLDIMQMQNWEHAQFIFDNLSKIPDDPHGCDFSRIKPWYLDSQAQYLRQTILLSRHDTPESRSLFHLHCHNLAGKIRLDGPSLPGILDRIKFGVRQTFERIDLEGGQGMEGEAAVSEVEARLQWFTNKIIPSLLKSAMMRQNTLIMVPSYFDFTRLTNHLRKNEALSFAAISEYSSNAEISRARTEFFKGKKPFLIITERLHFYRRYKIRGAKNLVFYSIPDHAQFYSELLETPFLPSQKKIRAQQKKMARKHPERKRKRKHASTEDDEEEEEADEEEEEDEEEVDAEEITARVLFSRFDYLKLERVVGSVNASLMLTKNEAKYQFR